MSREFPTSNGGGPLPWYSIFRVSLSNLFMLGTLFLACAGGYFQIKQHDRDIASLQQTTQTKDAAAADLKLVITKLDDLKERLVRMENRLDDAAARRKAK